MGQVEATHSVIIMQVLTSLLLLLLLPVRGELVVVILWHHATVCVEHVHAGGELTCAAHQLSDVSYPLLRPLEYDLSVAICLFAAIGQQHHLVCLHRLVCSSPRTLGYLQRQVCALLSLMLLLHGGCNSVVHAQILLKLDIVLALGIF